jgi:hypothetical protein
LEFIQPFLSHIAFAALIAAQFSAAVVARGMEPSAIALPVRSARRALTAHGSA